MGLKLGAPSASALSATFVGHAGRGTSDDTSRLNALLSAARLAGGGTVYGMPGEEYKISAPLVLGTGVHLDLSQSDLTLLPGSNCHMVTNYANLNPVASANDGAVTSGSNVVTTSLGATAVVGQTLTIANAAANGYGPLIGRISARTATTITLMDLDGLTPANATATVSGKAVVLSNVDTGFSFRVGTAARGANGPSGTTSTPGSPLYGTDVAGHSVFLKHADHWLVDIRNATSTGGISFVWPTNVRHFEVSIHDSTVVRTALQIVGPAFDGDVPVVRGDSTDDLVNFCGNVYPDQTNTCGNVKAIRYGVIEGRNVGHNAGSILKLNAGQGLKVSDIKGGQITGYGKTPIFIGEDTYYPETTGGTYGDIDLGQISCKGTAGSLMLLNSVTAGNIKATGFADGLIQVAGTTNGTIQSLDLDMEFQGHTSTLFQITAAQTIRRLRFGGSYTNVKSQRLATIGSSSRVFHLVVDMAMDIDTTTCTVFDFGGTAVVDRVTFTPECSAKFLDTSGQSYLINVPTGVEIRSVHLGGQYQGGNNLIRSVASSTLRALSIDNLSTYQVGRVAGLGAATVLTLGTLHMRDPINAPFYGTAAVDVYGSGFVRSGGVSRVFEAGAGGSFNVWSPQIRTDIAHINATAGAQAYNTNSASGPTGIVHYDGAAWIPLNGYKRTGTATLVGGTVTVADTAITANSRVRVFVQTPGGTPGAPYVSAKTASTGFTITSTSASDTSVVRYEVVTD